MFSWGSVGCERAIMQHRQRAMTHRALKIEKNFAILFNMPLCSPLINENEHFESRHAIEASLPTMHQLMLAARFRLDLRILRHPPRQRFIYGMRIKWDIAANINAILFNFFLHIAGGWLRCALCGGVQMAFAWKKRAHFVVSRDGDGNDNNFTVNYALLQVYAKSISRRDFMQQNSWKFIQGVAIIKSECFFSLHFAML